MWLALPGQIGLSTTYLKVSTRPLSASAEHSCVLCTLLITVVNEAWPLSIKFPMRVHVSLVAEPVTIYFEIIWITRSVYGLFTLNTRLRRPIRCFLISESIDGYIFCRNITPVPCIDHLNTQNTCGVTWNSHDVANGEVPNLFVCMR